MPGMLIVATTASLFIWTSLVAAAGSARQASVLAVGTPRIAANCGKPAMSAMRLNCCLRRHASASACICAGSAAWILPIQSCWSA